jgi:hypothetical protein
VDGSGQGGIVVLLFFQFSDAKQLGSSIG